MPNTCATCAFWRAPLSETRRVCSMRGVVTDASEACDCHSALWAVPFSDEAEVSDEVAMAELWGEAT